jgi:hypothetical membrane protein
MTHPHPTPIASQSRLITCGILAGPIYVGLGLLQVAIRPGFDITRHALSLLSNGDLGWIQISNFLLTGALLIAGAIGLHRSLTSGRGRTWTPRMLALYGIGLIGAGIFRADPALGFPPGTPLDHNPMSWHGQMHFVAGGIGFTGLIASCFICASRYRTFGHTGWSIYSLITGVFFLGGFTGVASGAKGIAIVLFSLAVVESFAWLSSVFQHIRSQGNS